MESDQTAIANAKRMRRKLNRVIGSISRLESGNYKGHEDRPHNTLSHLSSEIIYTRIENRKQLDVLHKLIEFYIVDDKRDEKTITSAMVDEAMVDAMHNAGDLLHATLLALARYHLQSVCFDKQNA